MTAQQKSHSRPLPIVDSQSGEIFYEKIWGDSFIELLYGSNFIAHTFGSLIRHLVSKSPFVSRLSGIYHDLPSTKNKIAQFCQEFAIDRLEFEKNIEEFSSFNDFFIRSLKKNTRPVDHEPVSITAPADARYTFIPQLDKDMPFTIKNSRFDLGSFFLDEEQSRYFEGGSAIIARLCPVDCHRFYFPYEGIVEQPARCIEGPLYSVSPKATGRFPWIWWNNKRAVTYITINREADLSYAMAEIGATNCGNIVQTFAAPSTVIKGEEKGYFKLGGSAIILFFKKGSIEIDEKILQLQKKTGHEIYCKIGQRIASLI